MVDGRAHALVYSVEGQAILLHEYRSGDFFGAMTAPSVTHDADVIVIDDLSAFLLDGMVLALLAEQHGCISLALLRFMFARLQQTASRMFEHAALSAVGRVHAELLRQAQQNPNLAIRRAGSGGPGACASPRPAKPRRAQSTARAARNHPPRREALVVVAPHRLEELIL